MSNGLPRSGAQSKPEAASLPGQIGRATERNFASPRIQTDIFAVRSGQDPASLHCLHQALSGISHHLQESEGARGVRPIFHFLYRYIFVLKDLTHFFAQQCEVPHHFQR